MRVLAVGFLLAIFSLGLAAGENQPPAGWTEYAPKLKSYVVWFPTDARVMESEKNIVSKATQIRVSRATVQAKNGLLFGTSQIIIPPNFAKDKVKERFATYREWCLDELNGKLIEEKNVKLDTMVGKEFVIEAKNGDMARYRVFGAGVQIFRAVVIGTKQQVESKDADTFFDSFRRTPPKTIDPKDKKDK